MTARPAAKQGLLLVVSGPSGAGKTTVCRRLRQLTEISKSVSTTTRKPRTGEKEGVDYYFTDRRKFMDGVAQGDFLEHSEHFNNLYGTPRKPVERALSEGKTVLLEIDVNGAKQVMESKKGMPLLTVFLYAPDAREQERRLRQRGSEDEAAINTRLNRPELEMAKKMHYDSWVLNDDADRAAGEIFSLIRKAKEKYEHGR